MRLARVVSAHDQRNPALDRLVETAGLDVLQLDYVWPHTCGPMYAVGMLRQLRTLHKTLYLDPNLHLVTNAGGGDPRAFVEDVAQYLCEHGDAKLPLTAIRGDNVLPCLEELAAEGVELRDIATGTTLDELTQPLLAAQVELGAGPLSTAWNEGSRFVVAGCYDLAAPAIATAVSALGWSWEQVDELAELAVAASLPETLIEIDSVNGLTVQAYSGEALDLLDIRGTILLAASNDGMIRHADVSSQIKHFDLQPKSPNLFRVGGVTGHSTDGEWLLRLTYQSGYCAEGLLSCPDAESGKKAADQLHQLLDVENTKRRTVQIIPMLFTDSAAPSLIALRCQSLEREPCVEFVNTLTSPTVQSKLHGCHFRFAGDSPSWQPEITQLRCPVPRNAIAISVDTRPAKEWR